MKAILLCGMFLLGIFLAKGQSNYDDTDVVTPFFRITVNVDSMQYYNGASCDLASVDTVYMHSGAGDSMLSAWDNIVGHWGLTDSVGEMQSLGNNVFSICFNIFDYYSQATKDTFNVGGAGRGPLTSTETVYNIGLVFRDGNCPISPSTGRPDCEGTLTGKDETCEDIYIDDLPSGTPTVYNSLTELYTPVTASFVNGCPVYANGGGGFYPIGTSGINNVGNNNIGLSIFPNPFVNNVKIQFRLNSLEGSRLEIYDILGNKIADYTNSLVAGNNSIIWNGNNSNGTSVAAGVYTLRVVAGNNYFVQKLIKQ